MPSDLVKVYKGGMLITAINYFNSIISSIVSLLIIDALGPTLYGISGLLSGSYVLIRSIIFAPFGIPYVREIAMRIDRLHDDDKRFIFTVFITLILTGLIGSILYFTLGILIYVRLNLYDTLFFLLVLISPALILDAFSIFGGNILQSIYEYRISSIIIVSTSLLTNVSYIALYYFKALNLETIYLIFIISKIYNALANTYAVHKLGFFGKIILKMDLSQLRIYIKKALTWTIGYILHTVYYNMDSYILPYLLQPEAIGYYFFAKKMMNIVIFLSNNLKTYLLSFYSRHEKTSIKYLPSILKLNVLITSAIIYPVIATSKMIIISLSLFFINIQKFTSTHLAISIVMFYVILNEYFVNINIYSDSLSKYERHIHANSIALGVYGALLIVIRSFIPMLEELTFLLILVLSNFVRAIYWHIIAVKDQYHTNGMLIFKYNLILFMISLLSKNLLDNLALLQDRTLLTLFITITVVIILMICTLLIAKIIKLFNKNEKRYLKSTLERSGKSIIKKPLLLIVDLFI